MGRDKAVVEIGGRTMLARAVDVLLEVTPVVRIACGPSARYAELGRELVLDRAPELGPLGGLEAALASADTEYTVALACDMPRLDAGLLQDLVDRALEGELDACLLRSKRGIEPLCGVWRDSMAHPIRAALLRGERRVVAAFDEILLDGSRPKVGFCDVDDVERVRNVNTPADLEAETHG